MTGIPSNIGNIKVYNLKSRIALNKGSKKIPLNLPFPLERMVGATVIYGGYIGSQPMMNENGDYSSTYGLSFNINFTTKTLDIISAGTYIERDLNLIIFYV